MCGIAGLLRFDGVAPDPALLHRMTDALAHRGPDGSGHWQEGPIALGHRRLAIIDLSVEANQPMWSSDGSLAIVFNGEIYNYRELALELAAAGLSCRTTSDTEVILNLYRLHGTDCLGKLRGMFALALWDRLQQRLFLARDRVGIKPLYILRRDGVFAFASEIKAIAVTGLSRLRVDRAALAGFFRFLVVPQPASIFDDIRKLEPGRYLLVTPDGAVREETWWTPPAPVGAGADGDDAAQITGLADTLRESVRYHMVADVPVGAFLSGGLDSSAVVSLMRAEAPGKPIHAFSIGFPGQATYDEEPYARQVAALKQVDFHAGTIDERFLDDLDAMVWHLDEPFAISSAWATYYLARQAARQMKVVLTGDGGDELFAGYWRHSRAELENRVRGMLGPAAVVVPALVPKLAPESRRAGLLPLGMPAAQAYAWKHSGLVFDPMLKRGLYSGGFAARCRGFDVSQRFRDYYDRSDAADALGRALYVDFKTSLVDGILVKVDRTSMAHGLEIRSPLLDHHIVEFAARVPSSLKLRSNRGKHLLTQAASDRLPRSVLDRPKHGLTTPVAKWLREDWREMAHDCLLGPTAVARGLFEPRFVESLWTMHLAGRDLYTQHLWTLVMLELWHRRAAASA
jgi:asparagine synthase (glutamine-hydrolysing)